MKSGRTPSYASLRDVAKAHNRSVSTVKKWTEHEEWPCRGRRLDRGAVDAFVSEVIEGREPAAPESQPDAKSEVTTLDPRELVRLVNSPKERIKLLAVIERMSRQQIDREILAGGYVKREEVEQGRLSRIQAVKGALMSIGNLAAKLHGRTAADIELELESWARGVCAAFEHE